MTIGGALPSLDGLGPLEAIPASAAQEYVRRLESALAADDGTPVFFVHDGLTGTSDEFISDALDVFQESGSMEGTRLWELICRVAEIGATARIWWANNAPDAYNAVVSCCTLDELRNEIARQSAVNPIVGVRLVPKGSFAPRRGESVDRNGRRVAG